MSSKGANDISVLRLGHRRERDKRITSHLGLTARAFGADKIILCGEEDKSPLETWSSVTSRFGGNFDCYYEPKPLKFIRNISKENSSTIVHLTMYGEELEKTISKIPDNKSIIIIVGGTKVPGEVFGLADYNISIGNQPHSEVAALAIFLNSFVGKIDPDKKFEGGEIKVLPSAREKKVFIVEEE